jgi:hypothetical protein
MWQMVPYTSEQLLFYDFGRKPTIDLDVHISVHCFVKIFKEGGSFIRNILRFESSITDPRDIYIYIHTRVYSIV